MFVNGTHISPTLIKNLLRLVPTIAPGRLDSLFDNSDRQNVPKAHTLLKGISDACQLPEIYIQTANKPFVLLGELLYSFYAPHTTPSMSLSQQVVYLSKCAHILFALFRVDGTHLISSQLYYDIQASIKNALFCIAKTKALDSNLPFYLLQTGDDRLENRFGIYRTACSDRNADLLQMAERSAAAQQVDNILAENPDFDRKPYRLSLEGESGIDHINPSSWHGDVCVRNVMPRSSWVEGRTLAEKALNCAGIVPIFDPDTLRTLAGGLEVDLMRPFGHYVGVTESFPKQTSLMPSILIPGAIEHPSTTPNTPFSNNEPISGKTPPAAPQETSADSFESELLPTDEELPLEYMLPALGSLDDDDLPPPPDGPIKRGWVYIDSRWVHLESATRIILGTESTEKSTDRLRRVCGFTRYPSTIPQSDSILGDLCLIGQLILALVRVGREIALAAVRVTSIQTGAAQSHIEAISLEHLNKPDVILTGQILELECRDGTWYWNGAYVTSSSKGGNNAAMYARKDSKPLLVGFQARITELVNPTLSEHRGQLVWSFEHRELVAATDLLWAKSSEELHDIPICSSSLEFPYQIDHGMLSPSS